MEYGEFMLTMSLLYLRKQISFPEFLITNLTPMSCLPSNDVLNGNACVFVAVELQTIQSRETHVITFTKFCH